MGGTSMAIGGVGGPRTDPIDAARRKALRAYRRIAYHRYFKVIEADGYATASLDRVRGLIDGKRVAVVGNAESIFGAQNGPMIDGHDTVLRFNKGVVRDEASQGKRTDLLSVSCKMRWHWAEQQFGQSKVLWLTESLMAMSGDFLRHYREIAFSPVEYWTRLSAEMNGARPSSGLIALNLLRHAFSPAAITVFGFDWKATPTYYHEPGRSSLGPHQWSGEAALVAGWVSIDSRLTVVCSRAAD